ncbi:MAG TPA: hypothetical protein PK867_06905 [Pirellulales bacterium]|nr:hypothetical protein [Pirellulales bacterium]
MASDCITRPEINDLEDFCLEIGMGRIARLFLRAGLSPRHYFGRLLVHDEVGDALQFLTHTLSKQEAVWWACLCLRSVSDPVRKPKQAQALKAALRWVLEPNDANRRAAGHAGKLATFGTPAGAIAMSVFFSGGSILPSDQPAVYPDPLLTANIVTGTVTGLIGEVPPEHTKPMLMRFVATGIGVAMGEYPWSPEKEQRNGWAGLSAGGGTTRQDTMHL